MTRLYKINHEIEPDARDADILEKRESEWNARTGPRVGDFVKIGDRYGRFSHDWGDALQWSECGSFYLSGAHVSFSGGLNQAIPLENLTLGSETREGTFWFFHHGSSGAHRGVGARIPCRVWVVKTSQFSVLADGETYRVEAADRSDAWSQGVALARSARKRLGLSDYDYYPKDTEVTPWPA